MEQNVTFWFTQGCTTPHSHIQYIYIALEIRPPYSPPDVLYTNNMLLFCLHRRFTSFCSCGATHTHTGHTLRRRTSHTTHSASSVQHAPPTNQRYSISILETVNAYRSYTLHFREQRVSASGSASQGGLSTSGWARRDATSMDADVLAPPVSESSLLSKSRTAGGSSCLPCELPATLRAPPHASPHGPALAALCSVAEAACEECTTAEGGASAAASGQPSSCGARSLSGDVVGVAWDNWHVFVSSACDHGRRVGSSQ